MKLEARYVVAAVLLVFAWRGGELGLKWPEPPRMSVAADKPSAEQLKWASDLKPILPRMVAADREYLASFYDALGYVVATDGERSSPIIGDTEKFAVLHAGSLQLAIKRQNVGKYPGLDNAIDMVFFNAAGAEVSGLDKAVREKIVNGCKVLSWAFKVNADE